VVLHVQVHLPPPGPLTQLQRDLPVGCTLPQCYSTGGSRPKCGSRTRFEWVTGVFAKE
jgi:hypothetical protein